jgi:hypothetical protein
MRLGTDPRRRAGVAGGRRRTERPALGRRTHTRAGPAPRGLHPLLLRGQPQAPARAGAPETAWGRRGSTCGARGLRAAVCTEQRAPGRGTRRGQLRGREQTRRPWWPPEPGLTAWRWPPQATSPAGRWPASLWKPAPGARLCRRPPAAGRHRPARPGRGPVNQADAEWGRLPLHTAAGNGRAASVRRLLAHGADPGLRDPRHHRTPLEECQPADSPGHREVQAILGPLTRNDTPRTQP